MTILEKNCPFCDETIKADAIKCRFCGEFLETPLGGRLSQAEQSRQVVQGHAVATDTEIFFEGTVSRIVLIGPTIGTILLVAVSILIGVAGSEITSGSDYATVPVLGATLLAISALLYWLYKWLDLKNRIYRITNDRIEYEHGIFSKTIHNMDLWRIQDIALNQSLVQRILTLGRIVILSSDKDTPNIAVGPVYNARDLYNKLKTAQLDADRRRGVIHVEQ